MPRRKMSEQIEFAPYSQPNADTIVDSDDDFSEAEQEGMTTETAPVEEKKCTCFDKERLVNEIKVTFAGYEKYLPCLQDIVFYRRKVGEYASLIADRIGKCENGE